MASKVYFVSYIPSDFQANLADLRYEDHILQVNGIDVTNRRHKHAIKEASPSGRADPREINFITFIGKINLERMTYYDIKVII
ncbi:unnamed protein product [Rotaria sp. Silwood2]|nr:unnamed protein product [Rotaria sp. Silwood2]CAF4120924.1 unnamed protein product [Rotaria sp. Silwood2]